MTNYFLFAGEASGDLHGSRLIHALHSLDDRNIFCGVGGPHMRQVGLDCFLKMENFQVMGFSDVLKALPRLYHLFYQVRNQILALQPDCVILIDYPGFNLRLAKALRKKGYKGKLVQYICPTIWAHGKKRIHTLTTYYDLILSIFPFEKPYFTQTKLQVEYIGNPLIETLHHHVYHSNWNQEIGLLHTENLIALFPGSRRGEIQRHTMSQLHAAFKLKQRFPHLQFAVSCAQENLKEDLIAFIKKSPLKLGKDIYLVPPAFRYDLMHSCLAAIAKSGTVTLELALHHVPTIVHYELSNFNYLIAKYILQLKLSHYCIVNILSNKTIFPELIGRTNFSDKIVEHIIPILTQTKYRHQLIQACQYLEQQLRNSELQQPAAKVIQELVTC